MSNLILEIEKAGGRILTSNPTTNEKRKIKFLTFNAGKDIGKCLEIIISSSESQFDSKKIELNRSDVFSIIKALILGFF